MKKLMATMLKRLFVGVALLGLLYILFYPVFLIALFAIDKARWMLWVVPSLLIFVYLIGHFTSRSPIPLLSPITKVFLGLFSSIYKNSLVEAAKYFCHENKTSPFQNTVRVDIGNGISILGLGSNEFMDDRVIFVPTSPNPTSGLILLVPSHRATNVEVSTEEMIKFTLTSGAYMMRNTMENRNNDEALERR